MFTIRELWLACNTDFNIVRILDNDTGMAIKITDRVTIFCRDVASDILVGTFDLIHDGEDIILEIEIATDDFAELLKKKR